MCGIVGLYLKNEALRPQLGSLFEPMLIEMKSRGPDSAGVAVYRDPVQDEQIKYSLAHDRSDYDWQALSNDLSEACQCQANVNQIDSHAILIADSSEKEVRDWIKKNHPGVRLVGSGSSLEIFKEVGLPEDVYARFNLSDASGSHMIGHTRMATESAVTTAGSHPFATGADLCLVHNGSLSNHNRLREQLEKAGLEFQTENDSEVAAAYMTLKIREGASLREALEQSLVDLDGF
ncbi:UNVERIFIED_CONTAM: hypothetical protein GTU68_063766, partial [Idotea baltica]|nr:hypothetical protein [Idotea baltica]